jgi:uncharacterized RDD family membrane protein YckC
MKKRSEITFGIRLSVMTIDYILLMVLLIIPFAPFIIQVIKYSQIISHQPVMPDPTFLVTGFTICSTLFLNKDFFNGQSPAKRLLKMHLVIDKSGAVAGPFRCFIRNLTIVIWPVELIVIIASPQRRIGDYLAGTRLEPIKAGGIARKRHIASWLLIVATGCLLFYLMRLSYSGMSESWSESEVDFVEDSYNDVLSNELSSFVSAGFAETGDSADVRVYDKINRDSLKYISVLFFTKEQSLFDGSGVFYGFKKKLTDTLNNRLGPGTFILTGKVIILTAGHPIEKSIYYDPRGLRRKELAYDDGYVNDSTKLIREYFNDGKVASEAVYVHGMLSGKYREWYENGNLKTEIVYKDGNREGITSAWYENGQLQSEMLYEHGTWRKDISRWQENGDTVGVDD